MPPGVFNGGGAGIGGWSQVPATYKFKDGAQYKCTKKCSKAGNFVLEPTIFDPETGAFVHVALCQHGLKLRSAARYPPTYALPLTCTATSSRLT